MTELREEARRVIGRAVHAAPDDVVVFVGAGATAAINKLVGLLGLRISEPLERAYHLCAHIPPSERPIVLVGPYEHHSNELPWLDSVAEVVEVGLNADGAIDVGDLERKASQYSARPLKIGSFSAASNVTGVLTDVPAVARSLHRHGFFACFDYAAAAPYVPIDMHPRAEDERLDAIFVSAHKFIGGPQASGLLVCHEALFRTRVPERPGGGTVDYVAAMDRSSVDYVTHLDEREEGGTPAIMGDIRAGVAFLVKERLGPERIAKHEMVIAETAYARLAKHPSIRLLGQPASRRLSILSFTVDRIHHDLVSVLLDHLFGIQNRAGCSCAGPYGHRLLGIDLERSQRFRAQIRRGVLGIKPGWVRISLPFYFSDDDIEFVLGAIEFVASRAKDFLFAYELGWRDGVWRHRERPVPDVPPIELTLEALEEATLTFVSGPPEAMASDADIARDRARYFDEATIAAEALRNASVREGATLNPKTGDDEIDALRWFDFVHARGLTR
jgi:selenocysteine lyase/cysteine desulfurase